VKFIADFHIHSHFSIATSKKLCPEHLDFWARFKGIKIIGTGDFTHPGWTKELLQKLEPAEPGLFRLKRDFKIDTTIPWADAEDRDVRFLLTAEISSIYKKMDRVRKVHNVIFAPDFETVEKIQQRLGTIGNITSDGRPILGLDSRDLLEIALEASEEIFFVPAHIWTPWFSALGAKSGFDSIQECYGDLAHHIHAIETGLSSDPPMNWLCSSLDNYTIISNSDAHSPEKLGREANLFNADISYDAIIQTIKLGDPNRFLGTLEFFPQEGKYHHDGHRKCGICWNPSETIQHDEICTACGKKVVVGVMNRVMQLADRKNGEERPNRHPFYSLIPLKEILSEILRVGPNSKTVGKPYIDLIRNLGPELDILLDKPILDIQKSGGELLAEAIRRMRNREVHIQEGYDGEYGRITVFGENEIPSNRTQSTLFGDLVKRETKQDIFSDKADIQNELQKLKRESRKKSEDKEEPSKNKVKSIVKLNNEQLKAVHHQQGPALVLAGPGTGKTRVLTQRIAFLVQEKNATPENILAVTFTNKAAQEMRERLKCLLKNTDHSKLTICTFHALGYEILQKYNHLQDMKDPITIIDEIEKKSILVDSLGCDKKEISKGIQFITQLKQNVMTLSDIQDEEVKNQFQSYENFLHKNHLVDLDDLVYKPVLLFKEKLDLLMFFQSKFQWMLIDEFQDINYVQYQLIRTLMPQLDANLFAIGDPNQAIYGFRGGSIQTIQKFSEDYPSSKTYHLKRSYRCSDNILQASENVLRRNKAIKAPVLSGMQPGVKIQISRHPTDKSEAEWIARTIEKMMGGLRFFSMDSAITQGDEDSLIVSLSDFAVLVRVKSQMACIQKAFHDHSIPYQSVGDENLFDGEPIRSILIVLKNRYRTSHKPVHQNMKLLIDHFVKKDKSKNSEDFQKIIAFSKPFKSDYTAFFKTISLGRDIDTFTPLSEKVTLMTLHAAKGLEFTSVFIPGCEDGLLPYSLYQAESDINEERRLLYVGMTRAKHYLFLSHAKKRTLRGRPYQLERSPFIDPIEKEILEISEIHFKPKKDTSQLKLF